MTPDLDLVLARQISHSPERVWRAWTEPAQLKRWFCPQPWVLTAADIDLRPGGRFDTVMAGPDGEEITSRGCYTEIVKHRRLAFTDAMTEGWRPAPAPFMTAIITMEPKDGGTYYTATALHADPDARKRHEEMGFHVGWGTALDQMIAMLEQDK